MSHFLFIAVPTVPPSNVRFASRDRRKLAVSWDKPNSQEWSGEVTRYEICHSIHEGASQPKCSETMGFSYEITSFKPATKYFVTVSAGTSDGFGPKSAEISRITYGGMNFSWV